MLSIDKSHRDIIEQIRAYKNKLGIAKKYQVIAKYNLVASESVNGSKCINLKRFSMRRKESKNESLLYMLKCIHCAKIAIQFTEEADIKVSTIDEISEDLDITPFEVLDKMNS